MFQLRVMPVELSARTLPSNQAVDALRRIFERGGWNLSHLSNPLGGSLFGLCPSAQYARAISIWLPFPQVLSYYSGAGFDEVPFRFGERADKIALDIEFSC